MYFWKYQQSLISLYFTQSLIHCSQSLSTGFPRICRRGQRHCYGQLLPNESGSDQVQTSFCAIFKPQRIENRCFTRLSGLYLLVRIYFYFSVFVTQNIYLRNPNNISAYWSRKGHVIEVRKKTLAFVFNHEELHGMEEKGYLWIEWLQYIILRPDIQF